MSKITVALCLDDKNGLLFNNRRQSRDSILIEDLIKNSDCEVVISKFSQNLFEKADFPFTVSENPLSQMTGDFLYFYEKGELSSHIEKIDKFIIYKWNKCYPRDTVFDLNIENFGFKMKESYDFVGSSHEKITKEIYER